MATRRDDDEQRLIPIRTAARYLALGDRVLYAARDRGELAVYQISNRSYLRLADARLWLERHRQPARTSGEAHEP
jgi:hypothetical protein